MPSYNPPRKNAAFVFYVSLISQADTKLFQASATLAAGDVKVAVDDAAPANLTTLPVVDADFTDRIKVNLSAAEMNGDNITVIFSDAAGAEWCDMAVNFQTAASQFDDHIIRYNTAQAGAATSITLDASASAVTNFYNNTVVSLVSGTGVGQARRITAYNGTTKVATVANAWGTNPDSTSVFVIWPRAEAIAEVSANTRSLIADAVWDETSAGHLGADSAGLQLWTDLDAVLVDTNSLNDTKVPDTISLANIKTQITDALNVDTWAELASVPAAAATLTQMVRWLYSLARNKRTTTATVETLRNDTDAGSIGTAVVSDDGTTFTRDEWS